MGNEALRIEIASFSYGGRESRALSGVDLSFEEGEIAGIIGPVGSGKTTLLYCCNGLIPKEIRGDFSGKVSMLGRDISSLSFGQTAKMCSMVFQDPDDQLFNLTVEEEVEFGLLSTGTPKEEARRRARAAIKRAGLLGLAAEDPGSLSSGQKQKVAIACALAQGSGIMLLDEPVSSLDWKSSCEVYGMLSQLAGEGRAIIIAEQDTGLLARHADRIIVMDKGRVRADGGMEVLKSRLIPRLGLRPIGL